MGSLRDLCQARSAIDKELMDLLKHYQELGSIEQLKEYFQVLEEYKRFGTPYEISLVFDRVHELLALIKDYKSLGSIEDFRDLKNSNSYK
jgi:hypothetical protein